MGAARAVWRSFASLGRRPGAALGGHLLHGCWLGCEGDTVGLNIAGCRRIATMIRRWVENLLLGSRWLLAGLFVVLTIGLLALLVRSVEALRDVGLTLLSGSEETLIVEILKMVDLTLTGFLLVILIVSGFVNFLGRLDLSSHPDLPQWMMHIDFSDSKLWLLTSVIAISGIRLLDVYINVSGNSDREMMWSAIIYGAFVTSALALALVDLLRGKHRSAQG
jgi:uncharacterized protein (TIGR00645 family)